MLLIGGLLGVVIGGYVVRHMIVPCSDIQLHGKVYVTLSIGPTLPIATLQQCKGGAVLFSIYMVGYLVATAGTLLLTMARLRNSKITILSLTAVALMIGMPFLANTDPYAYALFAYEGFVLHISPYFVHNLPLNHTIAGTFVALFPVADTSVRVANYGSLFTGLYCLLVGPFGLISLKAMILAERVMGAVLVLTLAWLISLLQTADEDRRRAFVAIALNPLLLFESIAFTHGDVMMLVPLAGAYLAFRRGNVVICSMLCVCAIEIRAVAALSLLVLFRELVHRKMFSELRTSIVSVAGTMVISAFIAWAAFGKVSLGGAAGFGSLTAPIVILVAWILGNSQRAILYGTFFEAGSAFFLMYIGLRERLYGLIPIGALAALPIVAPWYIQWLAPFAILTSNQPFRVALIAMMAVAPLQTYTEFANGGSVVEIFIVWVEWLAPLSVYLVMLRRVSHAVDADLELCVPGSDRP